MINCVIREKKAREDFYTLTDALPSLIETFMFVDEASWRNGYAEDCKSLYPGSIPGEASSRF